MTSRLIIQAGGRLRHTSVMVLLCVAGLMSPYEAPGVDQLPSDLRFQRLCSLHPHVGACRPSLSAPLPTLAPTAAQSRHQASGTHTDLLPPSPPLSALSLSASTISQVSPCELSRLLLVLESNAFPSGLYSASAKVNHACLPNCRAYQVRNQRLCPCAGSLHAAGDCLIGWSD